MYRACTIHTTTIYIHQGLYKNVWRPETCGDQHRKYSECQQESWTEARRRGKQKASPYNTFCLVKYCNRLSSTHIYVLQHIQEHVHFISSVKYLSIVISGFICFRKTLIPERHLLEVDNASNSLYVMSSSYVIRQNSDASR